MELSTFNVTTGVRQSVSLSERLEATSRVINEWMDATSAFYTKIAGFKVKNHTAVSVNLVTLAMIAAAVVAGGIA